MLKTDAERRCWPFLWWWPLATSVGCGPAVGLCYGHGRLNRLRRLGRSMAYHYFHIETGGVAKGGGGASWRGAACSTAVADITKKLCRRANRFGTESSPHAKQSLLHCRRSTKRLSLPSQTRQRSSQTMENRVG